MGQSGGQLLSSDPAKAGTLHIPEGFMQAFPVEPPKAREEKQE
jgi:hypothetical protein